MSIAGRPRDNPNAPAYLAAMFGAFVGFWAVLPRIGDGVLVEVLAPLSIPLTVAFFAVLLLPRARRVALGLALGLVLGTAVALLIGVGLLATGS